MGKKINKKPGILCGSLVKNPKKLNLKKLYENPKRTISKYFLCELNPD